MYINKNMCIILVRHFIFQDFKELDQKLLEGEPVLALEEKNNNDVIPVMIQDKIKVCS